MKKLIIIIVAIFYGIVYYSCKDNIVTPPPVQSPVAKIDASATSGDAPLTVTFKDVSTGEITTRLWTFGDGSTSSNSVVTKTFTSSGSYSITLKVKGPGGDDSDIKNVTVVETLKPPTGVSASQSSFDYIKITWNAVSNAEGYYIYRATTNTSSGEYMGKTASTYYSDNTPIKAKSYYYYVKTFKGSDTSPESSRVLGYKLGWRFENVKIYKPSNGIGFSFDLFAYGFYNIPHTLAIYAIYNKNGVYYYVPGSGWQDATIYKTILKPLSNTYLFSNLVVWLYTTTWHPDYRNNKYPQYIAMKVYKSSNPSYLNYPTYEETAYYPIYWYGNEGKQQLKLGEQLSQEESVRIREQLRIEK